MLFSLMSNVHHLQILLYVLMLAGLHFLPSTQIMFISLCTQMEEERISESDDEC